VLGSVRCHPWICKCAETRGVIDGLALRPARAGAMGTCRAQMASSLPFPPRAASRHATHCGRFDHLTPSKRLRRDVGVQPVIESVAKMHRKVVAVSLVLIVICFVVSLFGVKPDSIGGIALGAITLGAIMLSLISLVAKHGPSPRDWRHD
jgi:hypothetical protein